MSSALPGLPYGKVVLMDYRPEWPGLFQLEAARLQTRLGPAILAIEHYGSTAIPGLSAKPVIDLLIGVQRLDDALDLVAAMEELGYDYSPDAGVPAHHIFGLGADRTHLAHFVEFEGAAWRQCIAFRDALRASPETAEQYLVLKTDLARRYPDDRRAYTAGKAEFVASVIAKAAVS